MERRVSGKVKLKLYKGGLRVVGRSSPSSLYDLGLSTYTKGSTFNQNAAVGFIDLWGLQSRTAAALTNSAARRPRRGYKRETTQKVQ
jgi:argininosuccinate synthase